MHVEQAHEVEPTYGRVLCGKTGKHINGPNGKQERRKKLYDMYGVSLIISFLVCTVHLRRRIDMEQHWSMRSKAVASNFGRVR